MTTKAITESPRRVIRASSRRGLGASLLGALSLLICVCAHAQPVAAPEPTYTVKAIAERRLTALPAGPLYWHIERFATLALAQAAAGPTALTAEIDNRGWLFTLGPQADATPGAEPVAVIGPVPRFDAPAYLLRANLAGGPPGAKTPVHAHPGSEAFYVLDGELGQKTPMGDKAITAGQTMAGHEPGMAMQVYNAGPADLRALVLFVVDATKPFSSSAQMP